ncbi:uncharacterized protein LOC131941888 [Physella acuta]|uniref:uncharacterized protein LOC131941888 n=1 Tax=Physella acuta TaxID=109671 RepID=UPI0027DC0FF6|nr:uncharacterized protein LOC131941888 [Physella acuta]
MLTVRFVCLFTLIAATCVVAQYSPYGQNLPREWPVQSYPDPHSRDTEQHRKCGRYNTSNICDPNGIITRTAADAIDNLINSMEVDTRCGCFQCDTYKQGYKIRVALLPNFKRIYRNSNSSSLAMLREVRLFTYMLSQNWRFVGLCNETVVIVYIKDHNILYTQTRGNARLKLSDRDITRVTLAVRPYFDKTETIADGIMEMIRRYKLIFQNDHESALQPSPGKRV